MVVTATEAKNRFGYLCQLAKQEPVLIEKAGRLDSVLLSAEQYESLQVNQQRASRTARRKAFEAEYGEWITQMNAYTEAHGIPGADLRPW